MFSQVALLKKRMKGLSDGAVPLEDVNQAENSIESSTQSPSKEQGEEPEPTESKEIFSLSIHSDWGKIHSRHVLGFLGFFFNYCIISSGQERASVIQLNLWRLCRRESNDRKTFCRSAKK